MSLRFVLHAILASFLIVITLSSPSFSDETAPPEWKSLEISYAEANLKLAEAQLAVAEHENQKVARSVPKEAMDSLMAGARLAQARLQRLQGNQDAHPYASLIADAESRVKGAVEKYEESLQANKIQPGTILDVILSREQAEAAVARARLALLKSLSSQPVEVRLQWEIQQLRDEIRALWNRPLRED